jgi:hypothetical protein
MAVGTYKKIDLQKKLSTWLNGAAFLNDYEEGMK